MCCSASVTVYFDFSHYTSLGYVALLVSPAGSIGSVSLVLIGLLCWTAVGIVFGLIRYV